MPGYLLLTDRLVVKKEGLQGDITEKETEAHVELGCLEVDILLPERRRLHVSSNALNRSFKDGLDGIIGVCPQVLVMILQEGQVAFPEGDLGCIVPKCTLKDFLSLSDLWFLLAFDSRLSRLAILEPLHEQRHILGDHCSIDGVFVADLSQY